MDEVNKESPKELTDIDVFEVSLVGSPANRRKFLLAKSEKGVNMNDKDLNENEVGILKRLAAFFTGKKEEVVEIKEVKPVVAEKQTMVCVMDGKMNPDMKTESACTTVGGEWTDESAMKEKSMDVDKADLRKQLDDANAKLADIKKAQRKGELETIAKSMSGKPEDNLTYLEALDKHLPADVFKIVIDREQSLEKKIKEGELFKEKGNARPATGTATEKINKMVQELVVKGADRLKAINEVIQANPELYELTKKENFRRVDDLSDSHTTEDMK